ncbi:hypothetical protein PACILC2_10810 [Paenibacillus cisolokensis]|uniref:Uncharacterized protein n=1 Tax=Paenibacillus cisolokensis TaxID=1658519 RepID=A0ABQ4N2S9_9BACL|nr:hypothetical protein [Paenibacillus cisolokensis]GIQ62513.1 hypothetical protein PACILC2_10810 [Paenibacillus cisolokensis]
MSGMRLYEKLIAVNDYWTKDGLERQTMDSASRFRGGVCDPENGIPWPSHTGTPMTMAIWACALASRESRYYRDAELAMRLELATEFMLRFQHDDGTISPGWTNLHSPPDTAFVVVGLAQVLELLSRQDWRALDRTRGNLRLFLERTAPALATGGCHTPNHRWVLAAALCFLHKLTGQRELAARAGQWLAEGIDCTEDGEWTERSNGIYNSVSDLMLIHASDLLGRPELLEPVRRNLRMMAYLVHPDGEVVTDYSGRQDFGHKHDLSGYFLPAKLMAHRDRDPLFAALAELAGDALNHPGSAPNNGLLGCLLRPELLEPVPEPGKLPDNYRVVINGTFPRERYLAEMASAGHGGHIHHSRLHPEFGAPIARERYGRTSVTVMTETNSFFALRHGAARLLAVQIASSFEPGYVRMNGLEPLEDGYRLFGEEAKGYYGPIPADRLPAASGGPVSPWYLLPHHLREVTHLQRHRVGVKLTRTADGWRLRVHCGMPDAMLTQISFVFDPAGEIDGDGLSPAGAGAQFWRKGAVCYSAGSDRIELAGGAHEHRTAAIRGAALPSGCAALLVNLVTPYDRTFDIRLSGPDRKEE